MKEVVPLLFLLMVMIIVGVTDYFSIKIFFIDVPSLHLMFHLIELGDTS
jgi:hypothetical protein